MWADFKNKVRWLWQEWKAKHAAIEGEAMQSRIRLLHW